MQKLDYSIFEPHHFNATREDFLGNGDIGRYVFIPGSNSRAREIADKYFKNVQVKVSSRGHDLYLGDIEREGKVIKVASISTGMGTPSVDLILSELIILGAKRFLRIGTAGGMQPNVRVGDVVYGTAAVRDEATSRNYVPLEFPAIANVDMTIHAAKLSASVDYNVHIGLIHSKDSLYAREFLCGPSSDESINFMNKMKAYGVLASEMECSHIYVLSQVYSSEFNYKIKSGCVLGIIGDERPFADKSLVAEAVNRAVDYGVNLICNLALDELKK
ncbi:MAG: hypothetical protein K2Y14_05445 [Burkholderiales bacterium]|nr:hypothetical protein [Burkholderiales bacterium]